MSRLGASTKSGIVDVKQGGRTRNWQSTTPQVGDKKRGGGMCL